MPTGTLAAAATASDRCRDQARLSGPGPLQAGADRAVRSRLPDAQVSVDAGRCAPDPATPGCARSKSDTRRTVPTAYAARRAAAALQRHPRRHELDRPEARVGRPRPGV